MPCRNVLKIDVQNSHYHVYARGHSRSEIFIEPQDYEAFISLLRRYLNPEPSSNKYGEPYAHLFGKLELNCFCLMPNHFHMLIYQIEEGSMAALMRALLTSYSKYFNRKYDRTGALFESRYKASRVDNMAYLEHISRYIHLNRSDWETTPYSSIKYYLTKLSCDWLLPQRVLSIFSDGQEYRNFVADYEGQQKILNTIKHSLANTITQ